MYLPHSAQTCVIKYWSRLNEADSDTTALANTMKEGFSKGRVGMGRMLLVAFAGPIPLISWICNRLVVQIENIQVDARDQLQM